MPWLAFLSTPQLPLRNDKFGAQPNCMFLRFFAFRQVSMKVWWWLALASTINEDLSFLYLSSKKLSLVGLMVWFVVVVSSSSSNFSISLVPSRVLLRIPLRFTFQLNPICPLDFLRVVWFPPARSGWLCASSVHTRLFRCA